MKEISLEGRPEHEALSAEELAELTRVLDAMSQLVAAMKETKTVGDAQRLEALADRLDDEMSQ